MLNIIVSGAVLFVFGAIWYTALFGKYWAKLMGFDVNDPKMKEGMAKPMIINFLVNLVIAFSVYFVAPQLLTLTFSDFLKVMIVVWVGFSLPIYVNQVLWERKPWVLAVLNTAYGLVGTFIISALVYFWPM
jgi:hypothetical protein